MNAACPMCNDAECEACEGSGVIFELDPNDPIDGGYTRPCLECDGEGYYQE